MHFRMPIRERSLMLCLTFALALGWGATAKAETSATAAPEVESLLGQPQTLGSGQFRYLGLKVYDAQMFAPQGQGFDRDGKYALKIEYQRKIRRKILLRASLEELTRIEGEQADHADILSKLTSCYRDIQPGDRIVAAPRGADALRFWVNGTQTCTLQHDNIRDRYMAMWIGDKARNQNFARDVMAEQR
ncbi:hypothetical protein [Shimia sp. R9_3]|uniref:hypothetical protein n=1 Tax=Shimia sp. R9_3 TaxID=2821113 RepID=UPI001ADA9C56|nr:hypothetical protein [Shimia sp. R9_3]MBO9402400.1 hypothetical protein [Shimia sp. R9_3]